MNLPDYQKMARSLFGDCPGCDECSACRVQSLIAQVWESGRRSGASSSADRKQRACLIGEWDWTPAVFTELTSYLLERAEPGAFPSRDEAYRFVDHQLEAATEWAGSRSTEVRKINWTMFMKKWLRREIGGAVSPRGSVQGGLFGDTSPPPSSGSKREQDRRSAFDEAVAMNSSQGRPSPWSTSSPTDKTVTLPEQASSSETRTRSH